MISLLGLTVLYSIKVQIHFSFTACPCHQVITTIYWMTSHFFPLRNMNSGLHHDIFCLNPLIVDKNIDLILSWSWCSLSNTKLFVRCSYVIDCSGCVVRLSVSVHVYTILGSTLLMCKNFRCLGAWAAWLVVVVSTLAPQSLTRWHLESGPGPARTATGLRRYGAKMGSTWHTG